MTTSTDAIHIIPRFAFENGGAIDDMKVAYTVFGQLNAARDNGILLLPGTSQLRQYAVPHIGPGKTFDTDRFFVVTVDSIGGGGSSSPKDGLGTAFPKYTIRDMVAAQYDLVTRGLGLSRLHAVGGNSMGAFQTIEWGATHPGLMKGLCLWVPAARSDAHFKAIADAMAGTLTLAAGYRDGAYTDNPVEGIRRAILVYFPWVTTDAHLRTLTSDKAYEEARAAFAGPRATAWDANSILWRYNASRNHDVSAPYGGDMTAALARVTARALIVAGQDDRTIPAYLTREMYEGLQDAVWCEVPSDKGHLATAQPPGTREYAFVAHHTKAFIEGL
jgi:homoserine O-acetyltransferase/O-succinyltransferase